MPDQFKKQRTYVKFFEEQDLERALPLAESLGGVRYLGLSKGFAVFESEHNLKVFAKEFLDGGCKVDVVVQQTDEGLRGFTVVTLTCSGCGKPQVYREVFSRQGNHLCDRCLSAKLELKEEENEEGSEGGAVRGHGADRGAGAGHEDDGRDNRPQQGGDDRAS